MELTRDNQEEWCLWKVTETLDTAIRREGGIPINYYNSSISAAFHQLVIPVKVGTVTVGYNWKGYLLDVRPNGYDCAYDVINKGKI